MWQIAPQFTAQTRSFVGFRTALAAIDSRARMKQARARFGERKARTMGTQCATSTLALLNRQGPSRTAKLFHPFHLNVTESSRFPDYQTPEGTHP